MEMEYITMLTVIFIKVNLKTELNSVPEHINTILEIFIKVNLKMI
jgi:Trm5-related predicted tRNA methylase